ncbi:MAG: aminotransferase class I/II-fold pyridoxal phosphate-dependent enzyme [Lentisphaeria bacterium]|nr:aminotransferase class I/II-fold pyridoxal phosphate-dependent enzyme [Lentisphaeria bacterium]
MANRNFSEMSREELAGVRCELEKLYGEFQARNLKLNMARGKPGAEQLDISDSILESANPKFAADGTDCRNYGCLEGLPEMRKFFGDVLGIAPENIIVGGNSSLNLMYDSIMRLMVFGTQNCTPWGKLPKVKFLCPAPGYDRHFAVTGEFGIEMITVPMTPTGPDMDMVEKLVSEDDAVKGIWCVPLYSNPEGICYSDETVTRLSSMKCAAPDFRIFWDNAYGVHHLYEPVVLKDIFAECEKYGNPDRVLYFFSTSKITYPGAGVAMMASSSANCAEVLKRMTIQTIGHDKLNQLRTLQFLKDAEGLKKQMERQAALLRPKFELVLNTLEKELCGTGLASWQKPKGGYFVALDTMDGCAGETIRLAKEAGVAMTGAGATFPYKNDPRDRNIRIAPTFPPIEELAVAMELFCVCVKLAAVRKLLAE